MEVVDELEFLTEEEDTIGVLEVEITTAVLEVLTNKVMMEENANVRPPATLGVMLQYIG